MRFAIQREAERCEAELALEHQRRLEQAVELIKAEISQQQLDPSFVAVAAEMAEHSRRFAAEVARRTSGCAGLSPEEAAALIEAGS